MKKEFTNFENLIKAHLCNENAEIIGSEILENDLGIYVLVHYTVSDEFQEKEELWHKNRTMEILLKRKEINEGLPISSYAAI